MLIAEAYLTHLSFFPAKHLHELHQQICANPDTDQLINGLEMRKQFQDHYPLPYGMGPIPPPSKDVGFLVHVTHPKISFSSALALNYKSGG